MSTAANVPARESATTARERRERYGLLLAALVSAFAFQGIASPGAWQQVVITALLAVTLLLALWAGGIRPLIIRSIAAIAAVIVVFSVVEAATGHVGGAGTRIANLLLVVLAPPAIVVGVVRTLRARGQVTVEGPYLDAKATTQLAITGGTGEYSNARGWMTLHLRSDGNFDFVFHFQP